MSRSGIAGSHGSSVFRFLRNLHAVTQSVYTSHHSKRLNPRWHFIFLIFFFYLLATLHKVQDLNFPDQGLNPHPLHGQAESSSLHHEGSPQILSPWSAGWSQHYEFVLTPGWAHTNLTYAPHGAFTGWETNSAFPVLEKTKHPRSG